MPEIDPITREEKLWSGEDIEPITREEMYIKHIFDKTQSIPSKPITRKEMLLEKAGEGGGSDVTIKQLSVTENGTYSEEGTAYSPVTVNVPAPPIPDNAYLLNEVEGLPSDIATFTDGSTLPMPKLQVGIEPQQDLHGYDSPWVGGSGKNKFDSDTVLSAFTKNNNKYVGKPGSVVGTYVISGGFKTNTQYTLSYKAYNNTSTPSNFRFVFIYTDGTEEIIGGFVDTTTEKVIVGTSAKNKTISKITRNYGDGAEFTLYDIQLEEGSTATSYLPYSNICPISGWTEANVVVSPTTDAEDGQTYNIQFKDGDNPLAVYGGTLDVISGRLTVDRAYVDLGTRTWSQIIRNGILYFYNIITDIKPGSNVAYAINSHYPKSVGTPLDNSFSVGWEYLGTKAFCIRDDSYSSVPDFSTAMNGVQLVYELANPITYQLTPTQVKSLLGSNNVWCDTGDIEELEYFSKEA